MSARAEAWRDEFARSHALFGEASAVLPGGLAHDSRVADPFPLYMARAAGARKWDVDGNEYVDYWMGHGALVMGHAYQPVVDAVCRQVALGTHLGACHELEVRWAQQVQALVPCAESVRFCSSGTEATLLAMRLARADTGRERILRFHDHFHGWHEYATTGIRAPYSTSGSPGTPEAVGGSLRVVSDTDLDAVATALAARDVAGVILEPTGAAWGTVPLTPGFVEGLRAITAETGTLLIFDEVITGFRLAPGGAQELLGVTPDLCTLAKALGGGLPAAAIAGRAELLELLSPGGRAGVKVPHAGTFNANPLSAAAGLAALEALAAGAPQRAADRAAARLRDGFNRVLGELGIAGAAYGTSSLFHLHLGSGIELGRDGGVAAFDREALARDAKAHAVNGELRAALLERGVDFMRAGGMVSSAHTDADIDATVEAGREALASMGLARG